MVIGRALLCASDGAVVSHSEKWASEPVLQRSAPRLPRRRRRLRVQDGEHCREIRPGAEVDDALCAADPGQVVAAADDLAVIEVGCMRVVGLRKNADRCCAAFAVKAERLAGATRREARASAMASLTTALANDFWRQSAVSGSTTPSLRSKSQSHMNCGSLRLHAGLGQKYSAHDRYVCASPLGGSSEEFVIVHGSRCSAASADATSAVANGAHAAVAAFRSTATGAHVVDVSKVAGHRASLAQRSTRPHAPQRGEEQSEMALAHRVPPTRRPRTAVRWTGSGAIAERCQSLSAEQRPVNTRCHRQRQCQWSACGTRAQCHCDSEWA